MTPVVLAIGGTDSSGGAGLVADVRTLAALDVHPAIAVTAVTAQESGAVRAWRAVEPDLVRAQVRAVLADSGADAVKTGMLGTAAVVAAVADALAGWDGPLVCDPVLAASAGAALLAEGGVDALRTRLFPRATLVTPNAPEAAALTGMAVGSLDEAEAAGAALLRETGTGAVLVKGGHLGGRRAVDVLVSPGGATRLDGPRLDGVRARGTGCATASAIAAFLARGLPLEEAVPRAKRWVAEALNAARPVGRSAGPGPLAPPRGHAPA